MTEAEKKNPSQSEDTHSLKVLDSSWGYAIKNKKEKLMRSTVANRVISPILIVTHCPTGLTPGMKDSLYGTGQDSSSLCSAVTSPAHHHPSCGAHKPSAIRLPRQTLHQVSSCAFQGLGGIPVGILSPTESPRPTAQLPALMAEDTQTQHRAAVGSQSAVAVGEHPD